MIALIILVIWAWYTYQSYLEEKDRKFGLLYYLCIGGIKTIATVIIIVAVLALSMIALAQFGIIGTTM